MESKMIIHIVNGIVHQVISSLPVKYVVVDEDQDSFEPLHVSNIFENAAEEELDITTPLNYIIPVREHDEDNEEGD